MRYNDQDLQETGVYECVESAQKEINADELRMGPTDRNPMTVKVGQYVTYIDKDDDHATAHDTARDGERYCLRKIGVPRLINAIAGGSGRNPTTSPLGESSAYWLASNGCNYLLSVNGV